jgi:TP901 family phage tail tape measure protein
MASAMTMAVRVTANTDNLNRNLREAERRVDRFARKTKSLGQTIKGMLLASAGYGFARLVGYTIDFDDAMRSVGAKANAVGHDLTLLSRKARDLGATSSYTASQVAEMMQQLAQGGMNPKEIDAATKAVMNLSKATSTEGFTSARIIAVGLKEFGLQAEEAAHLSDIFTYAANGSLAGVEDLGKSFEYIGPLGKNMGVSIEETTAAFMALANVGVKGTMAGTAFRRILTTTGAEAEEMSKIFGASFTDINGDFIGLTEALKLMDDATQGLSNTAKLAKFKEAFSILGVVSGTTLAEGGLNIRKIAKELKNLGPEAEKAAKKMEAGMGGSWRRLKSKFGELMLTLGFGLEVVLVPLMEATTMFITGITTILKGFFNFVNLSFLSIKVGFIYLWTQMDAILIRSIDRMVLTIVGFVLDVAKFFGEDLLKMIIWTFKTAGNFIVYFAKSAISDFGIMIHNMKALWLGLVGFIQGNGFNLDFKEFGSGDVKMETVESGIVSRGKTGLEKELQGSIDAANKQLGQAWKGTVEKPIGDFMNKTWGDLQYSGGDPEGDPNNRSGEDGDYPPSQQEPMSSSGKYGSTIMQRSSSEAYKAILAASGQSITIKNDKKKIALLKQIEENTAKERESFVEDEFTP